MLADCLLRDPLLEFGIERHKLGLEPSYLALRYPRDLRIDRDYPPDVVGASRFGELGMDHLAHRVVLADLAEERVLALLIKKSGKESPVEEHYLEAPGTVTDY